jgi:hypothetical protein
MKRSWNPKDPEYKAKKSRQAHKQWSDPEYRREQIENLKKSQALAVQKKYENACKKPISQNSDSFRRKRLVEIYGNRCNECGLLPEWNGKSLILHVHDHKTNLPVLLCPNCHSQK